MLSHEAFMEALCRERMRAERSLKRFALLLIEFWGTEKPGSAPEILEAVLATLSRSTRKTDICGWYKDHSTVGLLFTELGDADTRTVAHVLLAKVTDGLCATLAPSQLRDIRFSLHFFPEDAGASEPASSLDPELYPDVSQQMRRHRVFRFVKRSLDVTGSLAALLAAFPLMLVIAVLIKLTSKGPVLFRQHRLGQFGRQFEFLKFRSMYSENDRSIHEQYVEKLIAGTAEAQAEGGQHVYKLTHDPRISPFGRILRRWSLDELPQFINVLKGDMSIVGPRPPIPYEVRSYSLWHKRRLLAVKPGITGLWQVRGRCRTTFAEMIRLDLRYARSWSLWLDLTILIRTPWAVLSGRGAC